MLRNHVRVQFITADRAGWDISYSRIVTHMGFELRLVSEPDRFKYVQDMGFDRVAYMGDGYHDAPILKEVAIGIAPKQARIEARAAAEFVTPNAGGHGAVMDACMYIMERMNIRHGL